MSLTEKMAATAGDYLQPGETIQAVFGAQTKSGWWGMFGVLGILLSGTKYRVVAVTNQRLIVFSRGLWKAVPLIGFVAEGPRTPIGEPTGLWWRFTVHSQVLYVPKGAFKRVREANALLG